MLYTSMRVNELCNLNMSDLYLDSHEILVKDTKNYHDRKVIISERYIDIFKEYLESLPDSHRNIGKKAVFISRRGRQISRSRVYAVVKQYGKLAGIKKNVTPHVLRHTLATNMITH